MKARTDDNNTVILTPETGAEAYILRQLCGTCSTTIKRSDAKIPELRLTMRKPSMDVWISD